MSDTGFEVIGIYHANGGLVGELTYVMGKLFGRTSCALCELSHGIVSEKRTVKAWRCALEFPFRFLHLNEIDASIRAVTEGRTPCIVRLTSDEVTILVTKDELALMQGDETALFARLSSKMSPRPFK